MVLSKQKGMQNLKNIWIPEPDEIYLTKRNKRVQIDSVIIGSGHGGYDKNEVVVFYHHIDVNGKQLPHPVRNTFNTLAMELTRFLNWIQWVPPAE